jgi:integrase
VGELTFLQVKNAKPGRLADGKGLYLLVGPTGCKSWVLRVQVAGKRRDYGLGSLDSLSITQARDRAKEWRALAKAGRDPSMDFKRATAIVLTFEEAARHFHKETKGSWKNPKHADQWINTLESYAFPSIGKLTVDAVDASEIQSLLIPIWQTKGETARRVRQRIATVLDYAKAKGWRPTDAPMRAVNTLLKALKQPRKGNFAAMPYKDVPGFMAKLSDSDKSVGRLALRFLVLTAARSGEVRGATWCEINLDAALWTVLAERMKMKEEHQVPLSPAALGILKEVMAHSDGKPDAVVFPGLKRQPLSDMTLSKVLKGHGGEAYTVHGFRSAFRDWCAETGVNNNLAESALAHAVTNRVEAAYRRTKFLDQRVGLMNEWARFCTDRIFLK